PQGCPQHVPMVSPHPQVLFTGVVASSDMEVALKTLGGSMATSVFDCTHLVTDRVRRTVKFLCAVARGVPIVTPEWLHEVPWGQGTGEGGLGDKERSLGTLDGIFGDKRVWGEHEGALGTGDSVLGDRGFLRTGGGIFGDMDNLGDKGEGSRGQRRAPWGQGLLGDKGGVLGDRG
ncbi:MDC1 protein, partial [Fregetta grallaria]|nr:MDC1 protein [Fregetta grallaria]